MTEGSFNHLSSPHRRTKFDIADGCREIMSGEIVSDCSLSVVAHCVMGLLARI